MSKKVRREIEIHEKDTGKENLREKEKFSEKEKLSEK